MSWSSRWLNWPIKNSDVGYFGIRMNIMTKGMNILKILIIKWFKQNDHMAKNDEWLTSFRKIRLIKRILNVL